MSGRDRCQKQEVSSKNLISLNKSLKDLTLSILIEEPRYPFKSKILTKLLLELVKFVMKGKDT